MHGAVEISRTNRRSQVAELGYLVEHPARETQPFACRGKDFVFDLIAAKTNQPPRQRKDVEDLPVTKNPQLSAMAFLPVVVEVTNDG